MGTSAPHDSVTVPSPRVVPAPASSSIPTTSSQSLSVGSFPSRRLSLNVPSARALPLPVPQRHGSLASHGPGRRQRASFGSASEAASPVSRRPLGSSLSLWTSREERGNRDAEAVDLDDMDWLDLRADQLGGEDASVVSGHTGMEKAVEMLLDSGQACLLVDIGDKRHAFVDFADLNVFLLLVLRASSNAGADELDRNGQIIRTLVSGKPVPVEAVCDISEKDPLHTIEPSATLRHLLPLFATGIHRVLVSTSPPRILSAAGVLEHLVTSSSPPAYFQRTFLSPSLDLPLHPLVSLSGSHSVLDAMQVMSLNGLSGLGVLSGSSGSSSFRHRRGGSTSSGSSGSASTGPKGRSSGSFSFHKSPSQVFSTSPSLIPATSPAVELPSPFEGLGGPELVNIITAETCARLVVPSEGKQALGMGLEQATKAMQVFEHAGQARGEERVPVHTITAQSSILHASHLILATSSSRVFLRTPYGLSPPLSPTPSLSTSQTSPPSSPSVSSLSLSMSDLNLASSRMTSSTTPGLPPPPATQLSPHYVVSISDILASLARAYAHELPASALRRINASVPTDKMASSWSLDPETMTRKRRESVTVATPGLAAGVEVGGQAETSGLESWKWATDDRTKD